MIVQRVGAAVVFAAAAALLVGCGPASVADGEVEFDPAWQMNADGSYPAFWEEPDRLILILGGSSSCPNVPTELVESPGVVTVTVVQTGGPVCTADLMISPTVFTLGRGRPDEVVIKSGESEFRLDVVDTQ